MIRQIRRIRIPLLAGIVIAAAGAAAFHSLATEPLYHGHPSFNDFKHVWAGSRLLGLGQSPYDERMLFDLASGHGLIGEGRGGLNPYVYLPFTGLVMRPWTQFSFALASRLWLATSALLLQFALLGAALHLAGRRRVGLGLAAFGLAAAWISQSMPVFRELAAGQLNSVLALDLIVILAALERRWLWLAGLAIAFGAMFKLSPGLFLLWLLWKRAWRPLAWTAGFLAVFAGWSLLSVGLRIHFDFLPLLADMRIGHSTWAQYGMQFHCDPANQAIGSFLLHIFAGACDTTPWVDLGARTANALTLAATLALLALTIFVTRRGWGADGPEPQALRAEWAIVAVASLLLPSLMWDHYVVQLLPVVLVAAWSIGLDLPLGTRCRAGGLLNLVAAAVLFTVWVPYVQPPQGLQSGLGLAAMSIRLWGVLILFGVALRWRVWAGRAEAARGTQNPLTGSLQMRG